MLLTIIKFLGIGILLFFGGRLLWHYLVKYRLNSFNKAALRAIDVKIKDLIAKVDVADAKTALKLAELRVKKKRLTELINLYEEKLNR